MKPIILEMEAFGPYAGNVKLDFEKGLKGSKLFLIHGSTGSGKTTILDAMCFALYGASSGGGREGSMMKSEQASMNVETFVNFKFALKDKIYQVRRNLDYEGSKARGTGTKIIKGNAAIYDGNGKLLTDGAKKVTEYVENLLGFKSDQFRQVVLLPQGDFKRFLLADSKKRQEILTILFKTGFYRKIEERLKLKANELKSKYELLTGQRVTLLDGIASEEELSKLISQMTEQLSKANEQEEEFRQAKEDASRRYMKAQAVEKLFIDLSKKEAQLEKSKEELQESEKALPQVKSEYDKRKAEELKRKELELQIKELQKVAASLKELEESIKNQRESELAAKKAAEHLKLLQKTEKQYEERLQQRLDEEKKYLELSSKLEGAQKKVKESRERDNLKLEIKKLEQNIRTAEQKVKSAESKRENQQKELDRLKHLSRAGRAALLAKDLKAGEPCPVCGSTEHPKIAISSGLIPTDEELEAAEGRLKFAENSKAAAEKDFALINENLKSKRDELQSKGDIGELATAQKEEAAAKDAQIKLKECRANINKGRELTNNVKQERENQQRVVLETNSNAAAAKAKVLEKQKQIPENFKGDDGSKVNLEIKSMHKTLIEMTEAWEDADKKLRDLEKLISSRESTLKSAQAALHEIAEQVNGQSRPDMKSETERFKSAERLFEEKTKISVQLSEQLKNYQKKFSQLKDLAADLQSIEKEYGIWARLSETANGRISFSRYILHSMFADIIEETNSRLEKMSNGRYKLKDKKDATDLRKLAGLELEIIDAYTGTSRPVETLSGGESFLASLSLALGLADVVQSYAGGLKLDTIFIDEGFGTLDNETLDIAMKSLIDLQKDGRIVGIISHVEELKNQIPTRLEVYKTKKGSYARFK